MLWLSPYPKAVEKSVQFQGSTSGAETAQKTRYYITSLGNDAQQALYATRGHWKIENQVHWVLDVVFREDACRIRKGSA